MLLAFSALNAFLTGYPLLSHHGEGSKLKRKIKQRVTQDLGGYQCLDTRLLVQVAEQGQISV